MARTVEFGDKFEGSIAAPNYTAANAGARWVHRFLMPLLTQHPGTRKPPGTKFLQISPDNEEEAVELKRLGYECQIVIDRTSAAEWRETPVCASLSSLPFADGSFDFVISGAFGPLTEIAGKRESAAREITRVCRHGGAILLTGANRFCPVGLTPATPRLHGPSAPGLVSVAEFQRLFVETGRCRRMRRLSVANLFGYGTLEGGAKLLGPPLRRYLRWSSAPDRPRRYAGWLNPALALWIER